MEQRVSDEAPPRQRDRRSAKQWASLIAAQADSGLSIAAFCRERGLAVSSFHAWRRRLSDERSEAAARGFVRLRVGNAETASAATSRSMDEPPQGCDTDGDADGGGHDDDDAREPQPIVVRFADAVEVHVEGRRLGEVLMCLRQGSTAGESS